MSRTFRRSREIGTPELIVVDIPCGRCARTLKDQPRKGQCPECGMENIKSLSVAVHRQEDVRQFQALKAGMDAQSWGTTISLLACVAGSLWQGHIAFDVIAFAVAVAMSIRAASAWFQSAPRRKRPGIALGLALMALGSGAAIVLVELLRTMPGAQLHKASLAVLLCAGLFWFVGECSKLRLLEECARLISGREVMVAARHLRWGASAITALIALSTLPAAIGGIELARHLTVQFVLASCVALIVVSLLGVLLMGRASAALAQQMSFAADFGRQFVDPRLLPDEPDWIIGDRF